MLIDVGEDRPRYFLYINGRWRWRPTAAMRTRGFRLVSMGKGGPGLDRRGDPIASIEDKQRAIELNAEWDSVRLGLPARGAINRPSASAPSYPPGSVGEAYLRAMKLREAERRAKGLVWTSEQHARDDWPRAWRWLEPEFGDCDPATIQPEHFIDVDPATGDATGLYPKIEREVSVTERHRTIKVWRALFKRMVSMKVMPEGSADPSLAFANSAPAPRQELWLFDEVRQRVEYAWEHGYKGLAACIAVAWDSMLSPVDARTLTLRQFSRDPAGPFFRLDRAKTGRAAAGTLTDWSEGYLTAYLEHLSGLGLDLHDNAPIFRTSGTEPGPNGGRRWLPRPYTMNKLGQDFRAVREACARGDRRQLADMRRSGAVEGDAGGASTADQSNKMANTVAANTRLRKTYNPVNVPSVRRFDEARTVGRRRLREQKRP